MTRIIEDIIKIETLKFRKNWQWYIVGVIIFGFLPYFNYYQLDGEKYNRVIQFTNGVDPMALETNKQSYCPGETLYTVSSFCKTREVDSYDINWWQSNGSLELLVHEEAIKRFLPVGCFPSDETKVVLNRRFEIPEHTEEGWHIALGEVVHYLPGNRPRSQSYKTEPYFVMSAAECTPQTLEEQEVPQTTVIIKSESE